jgi:hypothetical protein
MGDPIISPKGLKITEVQLNNGNEDLRPINVVEVGITN